MLPSTQQDFVFLGHNGGLGHLLTIPEISMYNIYDPYWLSGTGSYYIYCLLVYFTPYIQDLCALTFIDNPPIPLLLLYLGLPLKVEVLAVNAVFSFCRLIMTSYRVSRYLVDSRLVGRVVCLVRSPLDYVLKSRYKNTFTGSLSNSVTHLTDTQRYYII